MPLASLARFVLCGIAVCLLLSSCGQKGPLTLPEAAPVAEPPAANAPTDESSDDETADE
jgi:predicted small lipoprotein YifL